MSHTVTVTRTTTTTTTSAIIINTGYLKSWPGLLKFAQLILGIVTVGIVGYYIHRYGRYVNTPEIFFLLMAVTFLIGTFLLLTSCLISISTASIISKTIYEVVYHGCAFILVLAASLTFVIEINHWKKSYYTSDYEAYFAAAVIGLVNSVLYLLSTIFALRSYRGL
ncbi:CKLF-like MARVEL transmembrane domain-containing protein 8 [Diabrotica virgifera virgifera]|uniref:CKLF-like MARVEL transmembrane domain-containing protein 8 n=1 Tax=Diabrotica virgifera virgifera TaxID=50390 RepID=A0A6P7FDM8_DIAVI|nr:CKLF-like MARVEL transmembrane domain-containing protein 8 [Diabrotica virgifera virgifera]XP_050512048.1 CKLF-like MARVEL transmembrane domain-containing protein 8 [Diabrotica virgifera virgifera]